MKKSSKSSIRAKIKAANRQASPLNAISSNEIFQELSPYLFDCRRFRQLRLSIRKWAFDLVSLNMKDLYEQSTWGWNPRSKLKELSAQNAWCLLVKRPSNNESESLNVEQSSITTSSDCHGCVGFVHFRYVLDYGVPVLYCYEIQLIRDYQGRGIGRRILSILRLLARQSGMDKVIATVFKHNHDSLAFFKRFGFEEDETSPGVDEEKDYVILSLQLAV